MFKVYQAKQSALRIFCAMLLVFAGLAHRPVSAAPLSQAVAIELPDGSTPNLCISPASDRKSSDYVAGYGCDACRIAGSTIVPSPPALFSALALATVLVIDHPSQTDPIRFLFRFGAPPRAPPALFA